VRRSLSRRLSGLLLLAATAAPACGGDPVVPPAASVVRAGRSAPPEAPRDAVGVLVADQVSDVAPPFSGTLLRVRVRAGDPVEAGQVVAELDPRPFQEEIRIAEASRGAADASHRQAMVDIDDAKRRLAIETQAVRVGVSAPNTVEEARLAVQRAEAAAQRAVASVGAESARVATARSHLAQSRLLAPFRGHVALRYADPGAMLSAGQPVLRIVGGSGLRLRFALEPKLASRVTRGVVVTAVVDTVGSPIRAEVRHVSPALDPASGMLFAEAELPAGAAAGAVLRPGLAATVRVP
jgi:RND family efflux transporter MFP subunit